MNQDKEFYSFLGSLLREEITQMDTPLATFQKWDSVNVLRIIKIFEKEYGQTFSIRIFLKAKTVQELYNEVYTQETV